MGGEAFGSGLVDLLVLSILDRDGESYGYAVVQALGEAGIDGLGEAAVYASLRRLHGRAFLTSRRMVADNGRARRYYALTDAGQAHRRRERAAWESTRDAVMVVFGDERADGGER